MPAKQPRTRIETPYHTVKSAEAFKALGRTPRSLTILEKIEDLVADLTASASEPTTRKLADGIYKATADLRAALAQERMWLRPPKEAAEIDAGEEQNEEAEE